MDGRINNKGTVGNKGGNPGAGKLHFVRRQVEKYAVKWWEKWEMAIESDDKNERQFAMTEYNKLQCKMIPQDQNHKGTVKIIIANEADEPTDESTDDNSEGQSPV